MQKINVMNYKIKVVFLCVISSIFLSACQHKLYKNRPQPEPITQIPIYITPATYQAYRQEEAQNRTLIIYFEEGKKQNLMNAINAKGDTVIYDYKVFNAIAIAIKTNESTSSVTDFYQKIDGVLQVAESQVNSLNKISPINPNL